MLGRRPHSPRRVHRLTRATATGVCGLLAGGKSSSSHQAVVICPGGCYPSYQSPESKICIHLPRGHGSVPTASLRGAILCDQRRQQVLHCGDQRIGENGFSGPLKAEPGPGVDIAGPAAFPQSSAQAALFFYCSAARRPALKGGNGGGGKSRSYM
jgi:hypothetical protein